ncbi:MAG TPA: LacI family DNA-binding transcriptional regulator [Acidimicrobiia bacterium]|nr:LacI family DNA-binding transcriptional regulator [Acidimicrobiia bacterium]
MADRTTLKDVAREAGVHVSTASRALNPSTSSVVNPDTVERVLGAARRLGYRPHPLARGLRTNQTMSVGVVIPDVENPLFGPIIAGAESVLVEEGYSMLIGNADRGQSHAETVVADMLERHVDGLILATVIRKDPQPSLAAGHNVPVVLVNRTLDNDPVPAILGDDHAGIGLAVKHLASLGHRRIGHIAGPSSTSTGLARRDAFMSWMRNEGLEADPEVVEEAEWYQVEPGYVAADALLDRHPELTAIVAANDLLGLACYRAIRARGKDVGTDISVTGYNDIPLLDLMQPPLTAVRIPYRQMGAQAAATLLKLMAGDAEPPATIRLAPSLAVRGSTGSPR